MADHLPLIPDKSSVCADVRPVLREVFREADYLPPLTTEHNSAIEHNRSIVGCSQYGEEHWVDKYTSECQELWQYETKLKEEHAKRTSREPLPNIYKMSPPAAGSGTAVWKIERGLIQRADLVPNVEQNAGRDNTLWIKNILNRSSCELSSLAVLGTATSVLPSPDLKPVKEISPRSLSIGPVRVRPPPPPPLVSPPPPHPEYIVCIPPQLNFINFTVGQLHTQSVRLVNTSKYEIRLSLRPPRRRELDVQICGTRGLVVTSGAAAELRVHFRPRDVRALYDELNVRASVGRSFVVPISCYMQPPILNVLVPNVTSSSLSCTPGEMLNEAVICGGDILELGAKLLGDVHQVQMLLHCEAKHVAFFMLTEDAWISFCLDELTSSGLLQAGVFTIQPAWWSGGGLVKGSVWCRATEPGLHTAALRVLASTAVVRPLHLLADSLYFRADHITLETQEKDYDICSDDDPACEYYVHVGTAFPHRSLSATVQLVNHSPVLYSYYWSVRPWGVCSCWENEKAMEDALGSEDDSERLCIGAKEAKSKEQEASKCQSTAGLVRVEPRHGSVAPRSSCTVHVCVPDVGEQLGTQRAVLMLVLKDIPKESFPPDYDVMIVNTATVPSDPIPGVKSWSREICEVVCCQLEVWWEVVPVMFFLDPLRLPLPHSRRVQKVDLMIRATQLYGSEPICTIWELPAHIQSPAPLSCLSPSNSSCEIMNYTLPSLPNEYSETDVIAMVAADEEWRSQSTITRYCATRYPRLEPARVWLGVVPPGARLDTQLVVLNDTHQHICWSCESWRWWGENVPRPACVGRNPCEQCHERACSCALLRPTRGALAHGEEVPIKYQVNAPDHDGCVVTLVRPRRPGAGGARAALVAHRLLAPRLVLRTAACHGDSCCLDPGAVNRSTGAAVLRPSAALVLGRRTCYRLMVINLTPLSTRVSWESPIEGDDILKVMLTPKDFEIGSYEQVEITVVLDARKVCGRRIFLLRAQVDHAYKPLYLVIDAAVAGLQVSCEIPLGGELPAGSVVMKRTQREMFPWDAVQVTAASPEKIFAAEDLRREVEKENICRCKYKMMFVPPTPPRPRPQPQNPDEYPPIDIIFEPRPLTHVCACSEHTEPMLPEHTEPYCLQFTQVPLNTVRCRTVVLRNETVLTARWSATIRHWPRVLTRNLVSDPWAATMREPGVALEVKPSSGILAARSHAELNVRISADCWGLYRDQLLIQIENLEPIIMDIWVEAVGAPLHFPMKHDGEPPFLWMSATDATRTVRARNTSRSLLDVRAYVLREHEHLQDILPFRLYLRFLDVPPRTCPCSTIFLEYSVGDDIIENNSTTSTEEMDTGVELYLAADYGVQDDTYYKVEPQKCTIEPGALSSWQVKLFTPEHGELAPNTTLLLRCIALDNAGDCWYRPDPMPQLVHLRQAPREGNLRLSCKELRVKLCALALPFGDVMRIRKRFRVQNTGNGPLHAIAETQQPWYIILHAEKDNHGVQCGVGCGCTESEMQRLDKLAIHLEPRSSLEMCVEVCLHTAQVWPDDAEARLCQPPPYPPQRRTVTPLVFRNGDNLLSTLFLVLELEFPVLKVEPAYIDLKFVTVGDTRKTYFTVSHSSPDETLDVVTEWVGSDGFKLWPPQLRIAPGASECIYVQYTATRFGAPAEGCVRVSAAGGAGRCRAAAPCRASPARDYKCHIPQHDHTDDSHLLPPECVHYRR